MTHPQPLHPAAFEAALARALEVFRSMAHKVVDRNPTWSELPTLLSEDELRVFLAVAAWGRGAR